MVKVEYEINSNTYALIAKQEGTSLILEKGQKSLCNQTTMEILNNSCEYYGSSLEGRLKGANNALGSCYKIPIIIEPDHDIVFFPTTSCRYEKCSWLSLNNIKTYYSTKFGTMVEFLDGQTIELEISKESLETQILRASKLLLITKNRKKILK